MSPKVSPIFDIFDEQHAEAKAIFLDLIKRMKAKKAILLLGKISFLELFSELMFSVHDRQNDHEENPFHPFRPLHKKLQKVYHHKLVEKSLKERKRSKELKYTSFSNSLKSYKKELYNSTYDMIVGSTFKHWGTFHETSLRMSQGLKPLMLNTGVNKVMQRELESFQLNHSGSLSTQNLQEIYQGLRRIIILENILVQLGFNSVFPSETHMGINELKDCLKLWYTNHLTLQSLTYHLGKQEKPAEKYLDWLKGLTAEKKSLSQQSEEQAKLLFQKMLL